MNTRLKKVIIPYPELLIMLLACFRESSYHHSLICPSYHSGWQLHISTLCLCDSAQCVPELKQYRSCNKLGRTLNPDVYSESFLRDFIYIGFSTLRKGYINGCRPILCLDGAFLKIVLGGALLTAVARDRNDQMYLISWTVIKGENEHT